ncbi:hypothetical protein GCM10025865_00440 [Paraoerskovia sediminicola]|uniref:Lipoyl-binding domain-containing protein n=1 Tax=Paraoerskovia sediminicola TaxID=1138587 RepID=A0ABN6X7H8_9CELL|nr:hypothetical protein GCM10025865_00440 [Paraoerskovia sediminicola]
MAAGDAVEAGDPVVEWDPAAVAAQGLSVVCPVVAIQAAAGAVEVLVSAGDVVRAGDPVVAWT